MINIQCLVSCAALQPLKVQSYLLEQENTWMSLKFLMSNHLLVVFQVCYDSGVYFEIFASSGQHTYSWYCFQAWVTGPDLWTKFMKLYLLTNSPSFCRSFQKEALLYDLCMSNSRTSSRWAPQARFNYILYLRPITSSK